MEYLTPGSFPKTASSCFSQKRLPSIDLESTLNIEYQELVGKIWTFCEEKAA